MFHCPRDRHELVAQVESGRSVWCCNICGGGFVDLLKARTLKIKGASFPREEWDLEIRCPKDKKKMVLIHHKGVGLDYCSQCGGVWLDGDEVAKVLGSAFAPLENDMSRAGRMIERAVGSVLFNSFIDSAFDALFS